MRNWKRSEITIETHEIWVIRKPLQTVFDCCPTCGVGAQMLVPEAAAALARLSLRTIYRWVEEGRLHFTETPAGELFICRNSLQAWNESQCQANSGKDQNYVEFNS